MSHQVLVIDTSVLVKWYRLFAMQITWLSPTSGVLQRALEIARDSDVAVYDATFAAIAEKLSAVYVTADQRFTSKVPELPYVRRLAGFQSH
ncbi:MAG: hypothetical protein U9R25_13440 [Chloroflexota bacterium]|nr:hypothetical protein [Chloroflexota bacterium]